MENNRIGYKRVGRDGIEEDVIEHNVMEQDKIGFDDNEWCEMSRNGMR